MSMAKAIGITRKIDQVGRVVIPSEIREKFGMEIGDKVEFYAVENGILLVKSSVAEGESND